MPHIAKKISAAAAWLLEIVENYRDPEYAPYFSNEVVTDAEAAKLIEKYQKKANQQPRQEKKVEEFAKYEEL